MLAGSLIVDKEKRTIPQDATAQRAAKLVLLECRSRKSGGIGKEVVCIQLVVSKEFEQRAVKLVTARLDAGVDHGTGRMAELSRKCARLDLELLHCIH